MFSIRPLLLGCAAAMMLSCTACAPAQTPPPVSTSNGLSQPEPPLPETFSPDTSVPEEPSVPTLFIPEASVPEPSISEAPPPAQPPAVSSAPEQKPTPPDASASDYDFSRPVPEQEAVDLIYFSDAAFVGDSRSEGFYLYGVKRGKNLSASGLSVFTFADKKVFTIGGTRYTAREALSLKEYAKVYLGFGVNELGYVNTEKFYQMYCQTIDAVRASQPYAVVYAQTMAPVNEDRVAANGGKRHLNNERVRLYNELIRKAAQEKCVPLLDVYAALAVDGSLPADASRDGIHINREYCQKQLDYLMRHTVDFDILYPQLQTEPEVLADETNHIPACDSGAGTEPDRLLSQGGEPSLPADPDQSAAGG